MIATSQWVMGFLGYAVGLAIVIPGMYFLSRWYFRRERRRMEQRMREWEEDFDA